MSEAPADAKREMLMRLLRERAAKGAAVVPEPEKPLPIRRIPRTDAMELSFGQERIWTLEQVRPEGRNNILVRFGLLGRLDLEALRRSIEAIIARHEILRTIFPTVDGRPVARILPATRWEIPTVDLGHLPEPQRTQENRRVMVAAGQIQFDLANGPLLQNMLLRFGAEEHIIVLCMHHIVSDGWSVDLLCQELAALYAGFATGKPVTLPELPVQFVDFAHWQRRALTGATFEGHRDYWKKKLAGPLPALELPFDRPPTASRSFDGVLHRFPLEKSLQTALREFSRREAVTLYTTLLTALKALLHRYSGQDDIVVGTFVAGRPRTEVEKLMGFFVNTLVLRTDFSGDPSFRTVLRRTRDVSLEAQANADFPFDALVNELRPDRDPSRSPFFDIVFNMQSFDFDAGVASAGVRIVPMSTTEYFAVTDTLAVFGYDVRNQLEVFITYNPELFDAATIERFAGHFTNLLAGIVKDPDQQLSALPLLSPAECQGIVELGRGPKVAVSTERGYAHYFEEQVRRTPDALAVVDDTGRLTYAELNARANVVAHALLSQGVGLGEPVAMCSERNSTLVTWILGALKAGAAYMPLDARYPAGRHTAMLRQSNARVVLVGKGLESAIRAATQDLTSEARMKLLLAGELEESDENRDNPPPRVGPQSLAYIIFTSGSTGTPKGAMVHHGAMLNHFRAKHRTLGLEANDVVAQIAPIGFDISLWQFLAVFLAGGSLRIAPDAAVQEPERLFDMIRAERVTLAQVVPSFLRAFLDGYKDRESKAARFEHLRALLLVGEALSPDLARRWLELWPQVPLVNGYGPSECADEATRQVLETPPGASDLTVPIGRPIDNVRVHILDRTSGLLPLGASGELCIAGAGVGLGYLNDPVRTAASFVPDPYGESGARLYRTGDRARMRADGTVEFLGRLDFQVKIRGHRIELGEIEAVLERHPAVRQAVVQPWQSPTGDRLAAYIVWADPQGGATAEQLRSHLSEVLPPYMTPEDFMVLIAMPLNANGKVNRRALPTPAVTATREFVEPRTEMEKAVATVWGAILNQTRIGVDDNFFDLGGHSLLAAQAAARLRATLAMEVSVRAIFEKRTLADLARHLEAENERAAPEREEVLL